MSAESGTRSTLPRDVVIVLLCIAVLASVLHCWFAVQSANARASVPACEAAPIPEPPSVVVSEVQHIRGMRFFSAVVDGKRYTMVRGSSGPPIVLNTEVLP